MPLALLLSSRGKRNNTEQAAVSSDETSVRELIDSGAGVRFLHSSHHWSAIVSAMDQSGCSISVDSSADNNMPRPIAGAAQPQRG